MKPKKFISVRQYAKKHDIDIPTVYRFIREHRFSEKDVKLVSIRKTRLEICATAQVKKV